LGQLQQALSAEQCRAQEALERSEQIARNAVHTQELQLKEHEAERAVLCRRIDDLTFRNPDVRKLEEKVGVLSEQLRFAVTKLGRLKCTTACN
jgi:hypothetical protein